MIDDVVTVLLAGGKGTRLEPLTRERAKPAVPFAGVYRIVDFALSNCLNSRQMRILVLTQYKSLSLEAHVTRGWGRFFHPEFGQWIAIASPQQRVNDDWYLGTANAVYQNIYSIARSGAEHVLVLAADHVYKMDYRRMLDFHRDSGGAVTVGTLRCPIGEAAGQLGVVEVDRQGQVVTFQEKPEHPAGLPGHDGICLASMGIYVFTAAFLVDELRRSAGTAQPGHDFGRHFFPQIIGREPVRAFTFSNAGNVTPYWRDVGTIDAYFRAHMDILADVPELDLYDKAWPLYSVQRSFSPPRVAAAPESSRQAAAGSRHNIFANGTVADGWCRGAVVGFDCRIDAGAVVEDSILFDDVCIGRGADVRRAILDEGVQIRARARVGVDADDDRRRGFTVSEGGITCVPSDTVVEATPASAHR